MTINSRTLVYLKTYITLTHTISQNRCTTVIATAPISCQLESMCFSSMYCSQCWVSYSLNLKKVVLEMFSLAFHTNITPNKHFFTVCQIFEYSELTGSDVCQLLHKIMSAYNHA